MKVAYINNMPRGSGMGNVAFETYSEFRLPKALGVDHIYIDYSRGILEILNKKELIARAVKLPFESSTTFPLRFGRAISKLPHDIFHLTNQNLSFLGKKLRGRTVVTCYDVYPYLYPKNFLEFSFRKFLYSGLKKADRVIVSSENTKKDMVESFSIAENRIKVVFCGVNKSFKPQDKTSARKKLGLPLDKKIILHVGGEEKRKNVETIIRALPKLKEDFLFVRIGKCMKEQKDLIKKYGLGSKVRYFKDLQEIEVFYNAADCFVFPSLYEGFGLPPLEAMACGCPVVVSDRTSLPEVVGNAGLIINPENPKEIAEAMLSVLGDKKLANSLRRKGLQRSKIFSWKKAAKEIVEVYEDLKNEE